MSKITRPDQHHQSVKAEPRDIHKGSVDILLGYAIECLRKQRNISLRELSELLGLPSASVSAIEKSEYPLSVSQLTHFAEMLSVPASEVLSVENIDQGLAVSSELDATSPQIKPENQIPKLSETQLYKVLEAISDVVCFKDAEGRWRWINSNGQRLLGVDDTGVIGRNNDEIGSTNSALVNIVRDGNTADQVLVKNRTISRYETMIDGHEGRRWLEMSKIPLFDCDNDAYNGQVVLGRDITTSKLHQDALLSQLVFTGTSDGIIITDASHTILEINESFTRITGYSLKECKGKPSSILRSGLMDEAFSQNMWASVNKHGSWRGRTSSQRKNGEIYPQRMTVNAVKDERGKVTNYVAILNDISQRMAMEIAASERRGNYDSLTQLPNRNLLMDRLQQAIESAERYDSRVAAIFIDLDRFKAVNDTLGHAKGDQFLKIIASRLSTCVRQSDTVGRIGGDEFVVMITDVALDEDVSTVCEQVLESFKSPIKLGGYEFYMSASLGVALYPQDATRPDELIDHADMAMYHAKDEGTNSYSYFNMTMKSEALTKARLEQDLRAAMGLGQLSLHYQPIVEMERGKLLGVEALLRWQHPEQGNIPPDVFIPVSEDSGLIQELGEWVLRQSCREISRLGKRFPQDAYVAVNVSARQWRMLDMVALVSDVLATSNLPAQQLVLEITEQSFIEDLEFVSKALRELQILGVRVLLDDFGTGYSSLSYLKRLPLNGLKVDKSFIRDLPNGEDDATLVQAILGIAKKMNLRVIIEGVETLCQHQWLRVEGACYGQGYLYSRPLTLEGLTTLLENSGGMLAIAGDTAQFS